MAVIVKPYTFLDKITVDASEINANEDTVYTLVNGNINSANILSTYSPPSSQVAFEDTADLFCAANIEDAMREPNVHQRGLHTIHIMPQRTGALIVYPGKIEVGGKILTVSEQFAVSGIARCDSQTDYEDDGFLFIKDAVCSVVYDTYEITASDIFYAIDSANTLTFIPWSVSGYDIEKKGYYYDTYRMFAAVFSGYTACECWVDSYNPDPPQSTYQKFLDDTEQSGIGLLLVDTTTEAHWNTVIRRHSPDDGLYYYQGQFQLGSQDCGTYPIASLYTFNYQDRIEALWGGEKGGYFVHLLHQVTEAGWRWCQTAGYGLALGITNTAIGSDTIKYTIKPFHITKENH